jgi:phosphopentomutase
MKKHTIVCKLILSYEDRGDIVLYCENVTDQHSDEKDEQDVLEKIKSGELSHDVIGPDDLEDWEIEVISNESNISKIDDEFSEDVTRIVTTPEWLLEVTDKEREDNQVFIQNLVTSGETVIKEFSPIIYEDGKLLVFGYTEQWNLVKTEGDYDPDQDYKDLDFEFISMEDVVVYN